MIERHSIAEARNGLPRLVHEVERGRPVELTRRGKPVAVLMSIADFRRLSGDRPDPWEAYQAWRATVEEADLDFEPGFWDTLRDRSPGRPVAVDP